MQKMFPRINKLMALFLATLLFTNTLTIYTPSARAAENKMVNDYCQVLDDICTANTVNTDYPLVELEAQPNENPENPKNSEQEGWRELIRDIATFVTAIFSIGTFIFMIFEAVSQDGDNIGDNSHNNECNIIVFGQCNQS